MKLFRSVALCAALIASLPASAAIVFDFQWRGDPSLDASIVSSDDPTLLASGTITINKSAGQSFTPADVTGVSISVTGDDIADFVLNAITFIDGVIAADGLSATVVDLFGISGSNGFGCDTSNCSSGRIGAGIIGGGVSYVDYSSVTAAQASFHFTAQTTVVPVPATLSLAMLSLGFIVGIRRRAAHT